MPYQESHSERSADAIVHTLGVTFGVAAAAALAMLTLHHVPARAGISLGLYAFGLVAMLSCSALYNFARNGQHAEILRRVDHAVIYVMIAGTYSPVAVMAVGGVKGQILFAFVWTVAVVGAALKLLYPNRFERLSIVAWLLLGWTVLAVIGPLRETVPLPGLLLLAGGCVLYSVGVVFHLWTRLPYHNAIWHCFVLAAAGCHYVAMVGIAAAGFRS